MDIGILLLVIILGYDKGGFSMKNTFLCIKIIAFTAIIGFALLGCGNEPEGEPESSKNVVNIAAIQGINIPVTDETPVTAITENEQYSGSVKWSPNNTVFAASTVYTANITLVPKNGYTLQGVNANLFTVAGATTISNSANSGVVTAVFPATRSLNPNTQPPVASDTPITIVSIGITAPVKDTVPSTKATVNTGSCTAGTVTWSPADNPFKSNVAYTATVTLTAASGHTFTGLTDAKINGETADVSDNTGASVKLTYSFPATEERTVMGIVVAIQPTKRVYNHNDTLDLAGLMLQVYFENGNENVSYANFAARNITTNPAHGDILSVAVHNGKPVTIKYGEQTAATSNLTVNRINPTIYDFSVSGTGTFTKDGIAKAVTVTANDGKTTGNITVKYNGSTTVPINMGTYTVTFDVTADTNYNAVNGFSAGTLTIIDVPSAPQNFKATPINYSQIALSWTAPSSNGGSPITEYQVSSNNGSSWVTASSNTSHTFTGLTGGTSYNFLVRAVNAAGNGATSSAIATTDLQHIAQWARSISAGTGTSRFSAVAVDSEGNIYAAGYQKGTGTYTYGDGVSVAGISSDDNVVLVKYNSSGTAQWARSVSAGTGQSRFSAVAVDSAGNIYAAGSQYGTGTYTYGSGVSVAGTSEHENVVLVKYNTSGTAQWVRSVSAGTGISVFDAVAVDSAGNIYAAGIQTDTGTYTYGPGVSVAGTTSGIYGDNAVLVKYNSSGTAQWARSVSAGTGISGFSAVAVDSASNIYAAGYQKDTGTHTYGSGVSVAGTSSGNNVVLVKYNSSGTAQWARSVSAGTDTSYFNEVAVDSAGNIYAAGYQDKTGTYTYGSGVSVAGTSSNRNVVLVKYNSSGTAQWARSVSAGTGYVYSMFNAVAVDSAGNIYAAGIQTDTGTYTYGDGVSVAGTTPSDYNVVLVKYNSSGTAQWARSVSAGTDWSLFNAVAVDSASNIYAAGGQNGTSTYGDGVSVTGSGSVLVKYY